MAIGKRRTAKLHAVADFDSRNQVERGTPASRPWRCIPVALQIDPDHVRNPSPARLEIRWAQCPSSKPRDARRGLEVGQSVASSAPHRRHLRWTVAPPRLLGRSRQLTANTSRSGRLESARGHEHPVSSWFRALIGQTWTPPVLRYTPI